MSTDLTKIYDHPAVLLAKEARQGDDVFADHFTTAASRLRGYEQTKGVTFTALDNEALAAVREAVSTWRTGGGLEDRARNANHVVYAVIDLLGQAF